MSSIDHVIVIGGSAGSLKPIIKILSQCPSTFEHPIVVIIHRGKNAQNLMASVLSKHSTLPVREVEPFDQLKKNHVYLAPSDYHLLIGQNLIMELDYSEKVMYSRPSIDVSFQSFAHAFGKKLIAVVLSGANKDCAAGVKEVIEKGGQAIVQNPTDAEVSAMPQATLELNPSIQHVVPVDQIIKLILEKTSPRI